MSGAPRPPHRSPDHTELCGEPRAAATSPNAGDGSSTASPPSLARRAGVRSGNPFPVEEIPRQAAGHVPGLLDRVPIGGAGEQSDLRGGGFRGRDLSDRAVRQFEDEEELLGLRRCRSRTETRLSRVSRTCCRSRLPRYSPQLAPLIATPTVSARTDEQLGFHQAAATHGAETEPHMSALSCDPLLLNSHDGGTAPTSETRTRSRSRRGCRTSGFHADSVLLIHR